MNSSNFAPMSYVSDDGTIMMKLSEGDGDVQNDVTSNETSSNFCNGAPVAVKVEPDVVNSHDFTSCRMPHVSDDAGGGMFLNSFTEDLQIQTKTEPMDPDEETVHEIDLNQVEYVQGGVLNVQGGLDCQGGVGVVDVQSQLDPQGGFIKVEPSDETLHVKTEICDDSDSGMALSIENPRSIDSFESGGLSDLDATHSTPTKTLSQIQLSKQIRAENILRGSVSVLSEIEVKRKACRVPQTRLIEVMSIMEIALTGGVKRFRISYERNKELTNSVNSNDHFKFILQCNDIMKQVRRVHNVPKVGDNVGEVFSGMMHVVCPANRQCLKYVERKSQVMYAWKPNTTGSELHILDVDHFNYSRLSLFDYINNAPLCKCTRRCWGMFTDELLARSDITAAVKQTLLQVVSKTQPSSITEALQDLQQPVATERHEISTFDILPKLPLKTPACTELSKTQKEVFSNHVQAEPKSNEMFSNVNHVPCTPKAEIVMSPDEDNVQSQPKAEIVFSSNAPREPKAEIVFSSKAPSEPKAEIVFSSNAPKAEMVFSSNGPSEPKAEIVFSSNAPREPKAEIVFSSKAPSEPKAEIVFSSNAPSQTKAEIVYSSNAPSEPKAEIVFSLNAPSEPKAEIVFSLNAPSEPKACKAEIVFSSNAPSEPKAEIVFSSNAPSQTKAEIVYSSNAPSEPKAEIVFSSNVPSEPKAEIMFSKNIPSEPKAGKVLSETSNSPLGHKFEIVNVGPEDSVPYVCNAKKLSPEKRSFQTHAKIMVEKANLHDVSNSKRKVFSPDKKSFQPQDKVTVSKAGLPEVQTISLLPTVLDAYSESESGDETESELYHSESKNKSLKPNILKKHQEIITMIKKPKIVTPEFVTPKILEVHSENLSNYTGDDLWNRIVRTSNSTTTCTTLDNTSSSSVTAIKEEPPPVASSDTDSDHDEVLLRGDGIVGDDTNNDDDMTIRIDQSNSITGAGQFAGTAPITIHIPLAPTNNANKKFFKTNTRDPKSKFNAKNFISSTIKKKASEFDFPVEEPSKKKYRTHCRGRVMPAPAPPPPKERQYHCSLPSGGGIIRKVAFEREEKSPSAPTKFSCDICGQSFNYSVALRKHTRIHNEYHCDICNVDFPSAKVYRNHTDMFHLSEVKPELDLFTAGGGKSSTQYENLEKYFSYVDEGGEEMEQKERDMEWERCYKENGITAKLEPKSEPVDMVDLVGNTSSGHSSDSDVTEDVFGPLKNNVMSGPTDEEWARIMQK